MRLSKSLKDSSFVMQLSIVRDALRMGVFEGPLSVPRLRASIMDTHKAWNRARTRLRGTKSAPRRAEPFPGARNSAALSRSLFERTGAGASQNQPSAYLSCAKV